MTSKIFKPNTTGEHISFVFYTKNGSSAFWTSVPVTISRFSLCSFPFAIEIKRDVQNNLGPMAKWIESHAQGEWTIYMEERDRDINIPNYYVFQFSDLNDAILFRLTWC